MYASAVGLTDALWLCPERALRLLFASVSFIDPVRIVAPLANREASVNGGWKLVSIGCVCVFR